MGTLRLGDADAHVLVAPNDDVHPHPSLMNELLLQNRLTGSDEVPAFGKQRKRTYVCFTLNSSGHRATHPTRNQVSPADSRAGSIPENTHCAPMSRVRGPQHSDIKREVVASADGATVIRCSKQGTLPRGRWPLRATCERTSDETFCCGLQINQSVGRGVRSRTVSPLDRRAVGSTGVRPIGRNAIR